MLTDVYELQVQYVWKHAHWNMLTAVKLQQWSILYTKEWKIKNRDLLPHVEKLYSVCVRS